jgi:surface antigen
VGFKPLSKNSPVWRNGTFIGRVEFGVVNAGSRFGIPSENLFRAGGIGSLRGYGYRSLGLNVNNSVIGQRYLAIGSLEYQHRITEMLSLGVFYDYGNVTDAWRSFDAVSGYGAGLQVRTPVGPVKLDLAYGQAIHRYRVHFSIGFSF